MTDSMETTPTPGTAPGTGAPAPAAPPEAAPVHSEIANLATDVEEAAIRLERIARTLQLTAHANDSDPDVAAVLFGQRDLIFQQRNALVKIVTRIRANPAHGYGASAPVTRSQEATALRPDAVETRPEIAALVSDLDGPISTAQATTRALQDLVDNPLGEPADRAVFQLAASIMGEINTLRTTFNALHEATRTPAQRRTRAGHAPIAAKGNGAPDPTPPRRGDPQDPHDRTWGTTEILNLCDEIEATKAEARYLWHRGAGKVWAPRPGDNDRRRQCYDEYFERIGQLLSYRPDYVDEARAMFAVAIDIVKERDMEPDGLFAQAPALDILVAAYGALNDAAVADMVRRRQEWAEEDAGSTAAG